MFNITYQFKGFIKNNVPSVTKKAHFSTGRNVRISKKVKHIISYKHIKVAYNVTLFIVEEMWLCLLRDRIGTEIYTH